MHIADITTVFFPSIRLQKKAISTLPNEEMILIKKISIEFSSKKWDRLKYLDWKLEQAESLKPATEYEQFSVTRLKYFAQDSYKID